MSKNSNGRILKVSPHCLARQRARDEQMRRKAVERQRRRDTNADPAAPLITWEKHPACGNTTMYKGIVCDGFAYGVQQRGRGAWDVWRHGEIARYLSTDHATLESAKAWCERHAANTETDVLLGGNA